MNDINEQALIDEIREKYAKTYPNCIYHLTGRCRELEQEVLRLRTALHDTIVRSKGRVPESAEEFYSPHEADLAEERRPKSEV